MSFEAQRLIRENWQFCPEELENYDGELTEYDWEEMCQEFDVPENMRNNDYNACEYIQDELGHMVLYRIGEGVYVVES